MTAEPVDQGELQDDISVELQETVGERAEIRPKGVHQVELEVDMGLEEREQVVPLPEVTIIGDDDTVEGVVNREQGVAVGVPWASPRDQKRVRRFLTTANAVEGKWAPTRFPCDACAWPKGMANVMYGPQPARVCMTAQIMSGEFHMDLDSPPCFTLKLRLLRDIDRDAVWAISQHWGGRAVQTDHVEVSRRLTSHKERYEQFFWSPERIALPGLEDVMGFTTFRPRDLVYTECFIGRHSEDVVYVLDRLHFIARHPDCS
ncbi:hypothetical protein OH76DRAFT_1486535 [Lentinus brumalis]|uniref:Uncharacterized protein n=1 Tax=Lentinus brumalis TaxID=2498619 RepID=A0A371CY78_9APHY|nr:hypothetical protein OH76DRAFT_1486535 [Polyporus brumalis]